MVTGGASAAYGSDAIAGVVNFIMKRNFEGFQVDGQYGENCTTTATPYVQDLVRAVRHTSGHGPVTTGASALSTC